MLGCFFDEGFSPPLAAMRLRWPLTTSQSKGTWHFPAGWQSVGPAPEFFGLHVCRLGPNKYHVSLLWNEARCCWPALSRAELEASSLSWFLPAIGTDLNYLLDQPIASAPIALMRAAA